MTIQLSSHSFLQILDRSQLVSSQQLAKINEHFHGISDSSLSAASIAEWLVAQNYVTAWQAEKLLQAKHRGFFLGPYQLVNRVARGGMSTIYAGKHTVSGAIHALKVLPLSRMNKASYLPRFYREAEIAKRLQHPNIVRVFDVYSASDGRNDVHFMAMELLSGRDLATVVNSDGPLPAAVAVNYIRQAAVGLAYAHAAGLVHRDIKPGNLFLSNDGLLRILDLGLAADFESEQNLTREYNERVLGTADYLAPEQAVDSHTADARADIYSLGCTFYFLLAGKPPFPEGTLLQRMLAHQKQTPPPLTDFRSDLPDELIHLLKQMLQKKRELRIQSAAAVAEYLTKWLQKQSVPVQPLPRAEPVPTIAANPRETVNPALTLNTAFAPELENRSLADQPARTVEIPEDANLSTAVSAKKYYGSLLLMALLMFPAGLMTAVIWPDVALTIRSWLPANPVTEKTRQFDSQKHASQNPAHE